MKTQEKSIDNTHNQRLKDDKTNDFLWVKKSEKGVHFAMCKSYLATEENLIFRRKHELDEKPDIHNSSMKVQTNTSSVTKLFMVNFFMLNSRLF